MKKLVSTIAAFIASGLLTAASFADVNPNIGGAHAHAGETTSLITSLRVQKEGMEFGRGDDRMDAEVIVTLKDKPGKAFGIRYHAGSSPATAEIIDLLKFAHRNQRPVTIKHTEPDGKNNYSILWVQMDE